MNKLLALASTRIGCGYVWGSQGQVLTPGELDKLKRTFGASHYLFNDSHGTVDASKWMGKQVFDCSGLVLWCLQQLGFVPEDRDYNADMFYHQLCTDIKRGQLEPGDLVFERHPDGNIVHIGIYAGHDGTVEAMGTRYGVVNGKLSSFNLYGRLKFDVGDDTVVEEKPIGIATIKASILNIRSGPGTSYTDIGDILNGDTAQVYEVSNGWYRIGRNKWICGDYTDYRVIGSELESLVDEMLKDGLITDKQYWMDVLSGKLPPNPTYLQIVLKRATSMIR